MLACSRNFTVLNKKHVPLTSILSSVCCSPVLGYTKHALLGMKLAHDYTFCLALSCPSLPMRTMSISCHLISFASPWKHRKDRAKSQACSALQQGQYSRVLTPGWAQSIDPSTNITSPPGRTFSDGSMVVLASVPSPLWAQSIQAEQA